MLRPVRILNRLSSPRQFQRLRHRIRREWAGLAARTRRLHLRQGEQGEGCLVEGAGARDRLALVAGELGVGEVEIAARQGHQREPGVSVAVCGGDLVGVQADTEPVVGIALVRGGDRLLEREPVVDLALVGGEVVGVEGLDPVQCHQVLPGPLQLQGQGEGHEVEDLLDIVRDLGRIGDVGEELRADELAAGRPAGNR